MGNVSDRAAGTAPSRPGALQRVSRTLSDYLHPRFSLTTVLVLFVAFDVAIKAGLTGGPLTLWNAAFGAAAALFAWRFAVATTSRERAILVALLVMVLLVMPELVAIASQGPNAVVHDGIMSTDAAADRVLSGLDPYGHDYIDSALMRRAYVAEAPVHWGLGHYVYPPGLVLVDIPLRLTHSPLVNMTWLWPAAVIALAIVAYSLGESPDQGVGAVVAVVLNPGFLIFFAEHYNELLLLIPALGAVALARRGGAARAGVLLGCALLLKQSAIVFVPLVALLVHRFSGRAGLLRGAVGMVGTAGLVALPFIVWSPPAFFNDTARFYFGSGPASDPIRGFGLTGILLKMGVIPNKWDAFPSGVIEALVLLPLTAAIVLGLRKRFTWPRFWVGLAAQTLGVFFFGRLIAPNYYQLVVTLLALGVVSAVVGAGPSARAASARERTHQRRAVLGGALVAALLVGLVIQVGNWLQPNPRGDRAALASAGGHAYLADPREGFVELDASGTVFQRTPLPAQVVPLSLSLDGQYGVLGTGSGLWLTRDSGRIWSRVRNLPSVATYGTYFTVSVRGPNLLAGAWGQGMWYSHDAGESWHQSIVPRDDVEFEATLSSPGEDLAATELGILRSTDGGATWARARGVPDRMTALSRDGEHYRAADWRGNLFESRDHGDTWTRTKTYAGGVWAMASEPHVVATSDGLYSGQDLVTSEGLDRREVVALATSNGITYGVRAKGGLYTSTDGHYWRQIFAPAA
ncbi:MAG: WD40/YVTN/BNR-like repeat-containing protein [Candidatus Dormibacteria bacterium]